MLETVGIGAPRTIYKETIMKRLSTLLVVATLGSSAFLVAPAMANYPAGGVAPPECAKADAKTNHPDWFRDGGYCVLQYNGKQQIIGNGSHVATPPV